MQNIPGIAIEKASDQLKAAVKMTPYKSDNQSNLFEDLFSQHANLVEEELALSPVSTQEKMLDTAPQTEQQQLPVNAAGTEATIKEEEAMEERDLNSRMTEEEFEEVRDDLKEYGMSDEEIAEIEEKVNSEEGMTWGQFVSTVAHKMAEMRKVEMSSEQKDQLRSFFSKFGFDEKESNKLIKHLENGQTEKVMSALKEKLDAMPQNKNMLFNKQEVEAFAASMNFSKEFTSKIKELFGNNMLTKDVKEAFTMIRQELANMDKKEQELVKAVGKVFAKTMGDKSSESSAARMIQEAVDLKPRVAEEEVKAEAKANFKQAVEEHKEAMPEVKVRKNAEKTLPEKATVTTDDKPDMTEQDQTESNKHWSDFTNKVQDNGSQVGQQAQTKASTIDSALKTGMTEADTASKTKAWEKISAPKVMKQVETAFLKHMANGTKQLTLQLTPENLGKLNIMLQVQGKEVSAVIRAENADAAKVIADNIDIIKNSLESQGLKVDKLDVQAGLTNNQDNRNWFGQDQHNMAREQEVMIAMRKHMRNMRGEGNGVAQDVQNTREQAINAEQGLHVIA